MTHIARVEVEGWMPYAGESALDLVPSPYAVVARYRENPRRSNWAGKTALVEAVRWCLYGEHRKRTDDSVINTRSPGCRVLVVLSDGARFERSRKRGSSTAFKVSWGSTVLTGKPAQEATDAYLGMGVDDYDATVSFSQRDVYGIVGTANADRRRVVSTWLQHDRWLAAVKVAGDRLRAAAADLERARARQETLEQQAASDDLAGASDADVEAKRELLVRVTDHEEGCRAELNRWANSRGWADDWSEVDRITAERTDAVGKLKVLPRPRADGLQEGLTKAAAASERARSEYEVTERVASSGFDGSCPVSCQVCPVADDVTRVVREDRLRRVALSNAYDLANRDFEAARQAGREYDRVTKARADLVARSNAITARLRDLVPTLPPRDEVTAAAHKLVMARAELDRATADARAAREALATAEEDREAKAETAASRPPREARSRTWW